MDPSLREIVACSESMSKDVAALFEQAGGPKSRRALLTVAMCHVSIEHSIGQRLLVVHGMNASAFALVRVHFEASVRAIWLLHAASEEWLEKFSTPLPDGQLAEPVLGPSVDAMLETLAKTAPPFVAAMLRELKVGSWQPMNSYVHGGVRPVAQVLGGYAPYQLASVLRNANGLVLLVANVFVIANGDPAHRGRIATIQRAHQACLPPLQDV